MVKFWVEQRKTERTKILERIKHCEAHGIGKLAMQEKARLVTIDLLIKAEKEAKP